ncbi:MAG: hypothetical protein ABIH65_01390 [Nanoarchaeota archaeon]
MGIKKTLKKINNRFSDSIFFMGFLTNFGLVTIALLAFLIKETLFQWPIFWNLTFIFIIYLILSVPIYKYLNWGNKEFNKGFIFSFILTTIFFISQYIWLFFL